MQVMIEVDIDPSLVKRRDYCHKSLNTISRLCADFNSEASDLMHAIHTEFDHLEIQVEKGIYEALRKKYGMARKVHESNRIGDNPICT